MVELRYQQIEDAVIISEGRVGGQEICGGVGNSGNLYLYGTSGSSSSTNIVYLQYGYNNKSIVGIGAASSANKFHVGDSIEISYISSGSCTDYHRAMGAAIYKIVPDNMTDYGYIQGLNFNSFRNGLASTVGQDNGTLAAIYGVLIQYGHYNTDPGANPQTTTAYGLQIQPYTSTGVVDTMYDIYLANASSGSGSATVGYGIYQQNTKPNYFAGKIGVGTTVADRKVEINDASGNCLRLTYNDANGSATLYADLLMSSIGDLTITTSGSTGIKIGTASGQKIGFFNATPVVQRLAYTQTYSTAVRTVDNPTAATLTDNSGGSANTTLEAIGTTYSQTAVRNNFADLAAMVNKNTADHLMLQKVVTSLIDDLQALGFAT